MHEMVLLSILVNDIYSIRYSHKLNQFQNAHKRVEHFK